MQSAELQALLKPQLTILKILWAALTFSIVIYCIVAFFAVTSSEEVAQSDGMLEAILTFVAISTVGASVIVRKILLSDQRLSAILHKEINVEDIARNKQTGELDQAKLEKIQALDKFDQKVLSLLNSYFVVSIISWVLNESVCILGLLLAFLAFDPNLIIPFATVAIILNILMRPQFDGLIERARSLNRSF